MMTLLKLRLILCRVLLEVASTVKSPKNLPDDLELGIMSADAGLI